MFNEVASLFFNAKGSEKNTIPKLLKNSSPYQERSKSGSPTRIIVENYKLSPPYLKYRVYMTSVALKRRDFK